jgi:hypothetical protein
MRGTRGTSRALRGAVPLRGTHLLCCCGGGRRGELGCEIERELGNGAEAAREVGEGGSWACGTWADKGEGEFRYVPLCSQTVGFLAREAYSSACGKYATPTTRRLGIHEARITSLCSYNHILSTMPHCLSTSVCLPLIGRLRRHPPGRESQNERYVPSTCYD